jgi:hypothetical protein
MALVEGAIVAPAGERKAAAFPQPAIRTVKAATARILRILGIRAR